MRHIEPQATPARRICVLGPSGAGKTTLATQLSHECGLPLHSFAEVYWDTSGGDYIKRDESLIDAETRRIRAQASWIVEGAYDRRLQPFLEVADLVFVVTVPLHVRMMRIVWRYLKHRVQHGKATTETWANTRELLSITASYPAKLESYLAQQTVMANQPMPVSSYRELRRIVRP